MFQKLIEIIFSMPNTWKNAFKMLSIIVICFLAQKLNLRTCFIKGYIPGAEKSDKKIHLHLSYDFNKWHLLVQLFGKTNYLEYTLIFHHFPCMTYN